jgi:methyl-accepting chemotaxis protein
MRNNQPVTNEEYIVPAGVSLVSKTDLHGTIIECNDGFEAASGFSRAELIGQPHNMIRHPDVPSAVFADMWRDLKSGIPWTQFVKNRRKNGGFYWVKAEATPLFENGKVVGYMSVRSHASEAEKQAAARAYQEIAAGRSKIKHGRVYSGWDGSRLNGLARRSPTVQLMALALLLVFVPMMVLDWFEWSSVQADLLVNAVLLLGLFWYGQKVTRAYDRTVSALRVLASGQPLPAEPYDPENYAGRIRSGLVSTNLAILESREEAAYQLDKARQLQLALDKLSSNVMMADQNYNITYMNEQLKSFLAARQARLKEALPNFDLETVIGSNVDVFHQEPSHNRAILDKLDAHFAANIQVAGYHFELSMLPIQNRSGARVGILVEWRDRTQEVQLLENVQGTVKKAQQGYLSDRIDLSSLEGVAYDLSLSINELMAAIQTAMADVSRVTEAMSNGNLTEIITNHYEGELGQLKNAINASISRLDGIVSISVEAAKVVDSASREVSQGANDLSDRVQNQAAALEQTSATMHEMNSTIQNNTQNAQEAKQVAQNVQQKAQKGRTVMEQNIQAMNSIQESSHKISDIVTLIDGIAFQTNLLALNAAVEAARAGEHGRGFAVVAGEVRALAQKSAEAAKDIKSLIDESVQRIDEGTKLTTESGEVLVDVSTAINEMTRMIEQIARASEEQANGISQVHEAINSIDQVTQQNAALVEETTAASESLSDQAKNLSSNMAYFTTTSQVSSSSLKDIGHGKPQAVKTLSQASPGFPPRASVVQPSRTPPIQTQQAKEVVKPVIKQAEADEWAEF